MDLTDTLPGNTYQRANYVSANLIWLPVRAYGGRPGIPLRLPQEQGRAEGDNSRIQMAFQYRF